MEADDAADLYLALGLDRDATAADVSHAYRRLARLYHPDSAGTVADRAYAASQWSRISRAHDVLGDPARRQVYDNHGAAGVAYLASLEEDAGGTVGARFKTPEELRQAFDRARRRDDARVFAERAAAGSTTVISLSVANQLADVLDPRRRRGLPRVPLVERVTPDLQSMAASSHMSLQISSKDRAQLEASWLARNSLAASTFGVSVRRTMSSHASGALQASIGAQKSLGFLASRQISDSAARAWRQATRAPAYPWRRSRRRPPRQRRARACPARSCASRRRRPERSPR